MHEAFKKYLENPSGKIGYIKMLKDVYGMSLVDAKKMADIAFAIDINKIIHDLNAVMATSQKQLESLISACVPSIIIDRQGAYVVYVDAVPVMISVVNYHGVFFVSAKRLDI